MPHLERPHFFSTPGLALTSLFLAGGGLDANPGGGTIRLIFSILMAFGFFSTCFRARN